MKRLLIAFIVSICACASPLRPVPAPDAISLPDQTERKVWVNSITSCDPQMTQPVAIEPNKPLTIIVHGCRSSAAKFKALAQVYEFHGQQAVCFNYSDRDRIRTSATFLVRSLKQLEHLVQPSKVQLLAHSQGGMVARRAVMARHAEHLNDIRMPLELVTISSPFNGVRAAAHCGSVAARILSFGLTVPLCQMITGADWGELPPQSRLNRLPGPLGPKVGRHLQIITDEQNSCREYDNNGTCTTDDFVFSTEEQHNAVIKLDPRVETHTLQAGHSAIVGDTDVTPQQLINFLQAHGAMARTPSDKDQALQQLLAKLY